MMDILLDAIVVGGGPTGLQGALTLARGQRRVALLDGGTPRNTRAVQVHNFVTRDGVPPKEFRAVGRRELEALGVQLVSGTVSRITGSLGAFDVWTDAGSMRARRILLAVGVLDRLPDLPGLDALWGETVFQCPYCHGHEVRGQRWAVFVTSPEMMPLLRLCRAWTADLTAFTGGGWTPTDAERAVLDRAKIGLDERGIARLEPNGDAPDRLGALVMEDGDRIPRDALLLRPRQEQVPMVQALDLARQPESMFIAVDAHQETSIPGIYAAGDMLTPFQSAVAGAASGSAAAAMINHALAIEDFGDWS